MPQNPHRYLSWVFLAACWNMNQNMALMRLLKYFYLRVRILWYQLNIVSHFKDSFTMGYTKYFKLMSYLLNQNYIFSGIRFYFFLFFMKVGIIVFTFFWLKCVIAVVISHQALNVSKYINSTLNNNYISNALLRRIGYTISYIMYFALRYLRITWPYLPNI